MFGGEITIGESLIITLIAIASVFIILLIIALAISSFKFIFKEEDKIATNNSNREATIVNEKITNSFDISKIVKEEEIVALIVASIESNIGDEDKKYKIVSFKEV